MAKTKKSNRSVEIWTASVLTAVLLLIFFQGTGDDAKVFFGALAFATLFALLAQRKHPGLKPYLKGVRWFCIAAIILGVILFMMLANSFQNFNIQF